MTYRVWRNRLRRYAGLSGTSCFRLLDVGCGVGSWLRCMERWFPRSDICGLDGDRQVLDVAGGHLRRTRLVHGAAEMLPFAEASFDVVSALHVLEHLNDPVSLLAEGHRVLRPGGFLLVATPNPRGIAARILRKRWPGYRQDHVSLKQPREWRDMIRGAGFDIRDEGTTGLSGFPVCRTMPLALLNWLPLAAFGYFPWEYGESYMAVATRGR